MNTRDWMSGRMLYPYPTYKDTDVPWLKKVPTHWKRLPLFALTKVKNIHGRPDLPLLSVYRDYGVILRDSRDDNYNPKSADLSPYKVVSPGDLVLNKMKTWQGSLGVSNHLGIVSPAYIVCELHNALNGHFIHYLLRSKPYIGHYNRLSFGVRVNQWDMRYDDFKRIPVFLPPPEEQRAIAHFLAHIDRTTRRYIRAQRRLIELLEEQKQALIQQAVTRGLDPDVPLKDSGIEWLGKIPAHWKSSIVKRHYKVELGKMLNTRIERDGTVMRPYLNAANIHWDSIHLDTVNEMAFSPAQLERYRLRTGDLLVTEGGATVGRSAIWNDELPECYYQNSLNRARSLSNLSTKFLYYWMYFVTECGLIDVISDKATFGHLTNEKLSRLSLLVPPPAEANSIVHYLDKRLPEFAVMEQRIEEKIDLIREYRTRLITDVVTGKLDVRSMKCEEGRVKGEEGRVK